MKKKEQQPLQWLLISRLSPYLEIVDRMQIWQDCWLFQANDTPSVPVSVQISWSIMLPMSNLTEFCYKWSCIQLPDRDSFCIRSSWREKDQFHCHSKFPRQYGKVQWTEWPAGIGSCQGLEPLRCDGIIKNEFMDGAVQVHWWLTRARI